MSSEVNMQPVAPEVQTNNVSGNTTQTVNVDRQATINNPHDGGKYSFMGPCMYKHTMKAIRHEVLDYKSYNRVIKRYQFFCHEDLSLWRANAANLWTTATEAYNVAQPQLQQSMQRESTGDIRLEPLNFNARNLVDTNMYLNFIAPPNGAGYTRAKTNAIEIKVTFRPFYIDKNKNAHIFACNNTRITQGGISNSFDITGVGVGMADTGPERWSPYSQLIVPTGNSNSATYANPVRAATVGTTSTNDVDGYTTLWGNQFIDGKPNGSQGGATILMLRDWNHIFSRQNKTNQQYTEDAFTIKDPTTAVESQSRTKQNVERYYKDQCTYVQGDSVSIKIVFPLEGRRAYTNTGLRDIYNNDINMNKFVEVIEGAQAGEDRFTKPDLDNFSYLFAPIGAQKVYHCQTGKTGGNYWHRYVPMYNIGCEVEIEYFCYWHLSNFVERPAVVFNDFMYFSTNKIEAMQKHKEQVDKSIWDAPYEELKLIEAQAPPVPYILPTYEAEKAEINVSDYYRPGSIEMKNQE